MYNAQLDEAEAADDTRRWWVTHKTFSTVSCKKIYQRRLQRRGAPNSEQVMCRYCTVSKLLLLHFRYEKSQIPYLFFAADALVLKVSLICFHRAGGTGDKGVNFYCKASRGKSFGDRELQTGGESLNYSNQNCSDYLFVSVTGITFTGTESLCAPHPAPACLAALA